MVCASMEVPALTSVKWLFVLVPVVCQHVAKILLTTLLPLFLQLLQVFRLFAYFAQIDENSCFIGKSACDKQPCRNGASCFAVGADDYWCLCGLRLTGKKCETPVPTGVSFSHHHCRKSELDTLLGNACQSRPCMNGGGCTNIGASYSCMCQSSFYGRNCELRY